MTTTASSTARTAAGDRGVLLADALSVNALTSAATGAVLALGGVWLDDALGAPAVVLVGVGFGLVLFAAGIGVALTRPRRLRSTARAIVAADLVWVAGAAVVVPAEVLTPLGDVLLTVVSMLVAGFAAAQALGIRRAGDTGELGVRDIEISASREVTAPPEQAWDLVADAAGYAAYAPGITGTTTDAELRDGMQRVCVDDRGDRWSETAKVFEEGHRYRMEVDTDTYPWHYRALLHDFGMTWQVEPTARGSRLTLTFSGRTKLGVLGRLGLATMRRDDPVTRIVDTYAAELAAD